MSTDKRLVSLENTFKALADQTRLRIISLLRAGEICVCDIHGSLGLPQPTVSRHLAYLRKTGLVATRKDGLWVHYRLAEPAGSGDAGAARRRHARDRPRRTGRDARPRSELPGASPRIELNAAANRPRGRPQCC